MPTHSCRYLLIATVVIVSFSLSAPVLSKSNDSGTNSSEPFPIFESRSEGDNDLSAKTADEAARGKMLYENHCRVCHDSNAHVRDKKKAKSKSDIIYWVNRWSTHLELKWNDKDKTQVVEYLNAKYYKY